MDQENDSSTSDGEVDMMNPLPSTSKRRRKVRQTGLSKTHQTTSWVNPIPSTSTQTANPFLSEQSLTTQYSAPSTQYSCNQTLDYRSTNPIIYSSSSENIVTRCQGPGRETTIVASPGINFSNIFKRPTSGQQKGTMETIVEGKGTESTTGTFKSSIAAERKVEKRSIETTSEPSQLAPRIIESETGRCVIERKSMILDNIKAEQNPIETTIEEPMSIPRLPLGNVHKKKPSQPTTSVLDKTPPIMKEIEKSHMETKNKRSQYISPSICIQELPLTTHYTIDQVVYDCYICGWYKISLTEHQKETDASSISKTEEPSYSPASNLPLVPICEDQEASSTDSYTIATSTCSYTTETSEPKPLSGSSSPIMYKREDHALAGTSTSFYIETPLEPSGTSYSLLKEEEEESTCKEEPEPRSISASSLPSGTTFSTLKEEMKEESPIESTCEDEPELRPFSASFLPIMYKRDVQEVAGTSTSSYTEPPSGSSGTTYCILKKEIKEETPIESTCEEEPESRPFSASSLPIIYTREDQEVEGTSTSSYIEAPPGPSDTTYFTLKEEIKEESSIESTCEEEPRPFSASSILQEEIKEESSIESTCEEEPRPFSASSILKEEIKEESSIESTCEEEPRPFSASSILQEEIKEESSIESTCEEEPRPFSASSILKEEIKEESSIESTCEEEPRPFSASSILQEEIKEESSIESTCEEEPKPFSASSILKEEIKEESPIESTCAEEPEPRHFSALSSPIIYKREDQKVPGTSTSSYIEATPGPSGTTYFTLKEERKEESSIESTCEEEPESRPFSASSLPIIYTRDDQEVAGTSTSSYNEATPGPSGTTYFTLKEERKDESSIESTCEEEPRPFSASSSPIMSKREDQEVAGTSTSSYTEPPPGPSSRAYLFLDFNVTHSPIESEESPSIYTEVTISLDNTMVPYSCNLHFRELLSLNIRQAIQTEIYRKINFNVPNPNSYIIKIFVLCSLVYINPPSHPHPHVVGGASQYLRLPYPEQQAIPPEYYSTILHTPPDMEGLLGQLAQFVANRHIYISSYGLHAENLYLLENHPRNFLLPTQQGASVGEPAPIPNSSKVYSITINAKYDPSILGRNYKDAKIPFSVLRNGKLRAKYCICRRCKVPFIASASSTPETVSEPQPSCSSTSTLPIVPTSEDQEVAGTSTQGPPISRTIESVPESEPTSSIVPISEEHNYIKRRRPTIPNQEEQEAASNELEPSTSATASPKYPNKRRRKQKQPISALSLPIISVDENEGPDETIVITTSGGNSTIELIEPTPGPSGTASPKHIKRYRKRLRRRRRNRPSALSLPKILREEGPEVAGTSAVTTTDEASTKSATDSPRYSKKKRRRRNKGSSALSLPTSYMGEYQEGTETTVEQTSSVESVPESSTSESTKSSNRNKQMCEETLVAVWMGTQSECVAEDEELSGCSSTINSSLEVNVSVSIPKEDELLIARHVIEPGILAILYDQTPLSLPIITMCAGEGSEGIIMISTSDGSYLSQLTDPTPLGFSPTQRVTTRVNTSSQPEPIRFMEVAGELVAQRADNNILDELGNQTPPDYSLFSRALDIKSCLIDQVNEKEHDDGWAIVPIQLVVEFPYSLYYVIIKFKFKPGFEPTVQNREATELPEAGGHFDDDANDTESDVDTNFCEGVSDLETENISSSSQISLHEDKSDSASLRHGKEKKEEETELALVPYTRESFMEKAYLGNIIEGTKSNARKLLEYPEKHRLTQHTQHCLVSPMPYFTILFSGVTANPWPTGATEGHGEFPTQFFQGYFQFFLPGDIYQELSYYEQQKKEIMEHQTGSSMHGVGSETFQTVPLDSLVDNVLRDEMNDIRQFYPVSDVGSQVPQITSQQLSGPEARSVAGERISSENRQEDTEALQRTEGIDVPQLYSSVFCESTPALQSTSQGLPRLGELTEALPASEVSISPRNRQEEIEMLRSTEGFIRIIVPYIYATVFLNGVPALPCTSQALPKASSSFKDKTNRKKSSSQHSDLPYTIRPKCSGYKNRRKARARSSRTPHPLPSTSQSLPAGFENALERKQRIYQKYLEKCKLLTCLNKKRNDILQPNQFFPKFDEQPTDGAEEARPENEGSPLIDVESILSPEPSALPSTSYDNFNQKRNDLLQPNQFFPKFDEQPTDGAEEARPENEGSPLIDVESILSPEPSALPSTSYDSTVNAEPSRNPPRRLEDLSHREWDLLYRRLEYRLAQLQVWLREVQNKLEENVQGDIPVENREGLEPNASRPGGNQELRRTTPIRPTAIRATTLLDPQFNHEILCFIIDLYKQALSLVKEQYLIDLENMAINEYTESEPIGGVIIEEIPPHTGDCYELDQAISSPDIESTRATCSSDIVPTKPYVDEWVNDCFITKKHNVVRLTDCLSRRPSSYSSTFEFITPSASPSISSTAVDYPDPDPSDDSLFSNYPDAVLEEPYPPVARQEEEAPQVEDDEQPMDLSMESMED